MEISCFCQCFKTCGSFLKCFITILIIPIRIFLVFQIEGVVFVVFQNEHHKYVLMFFQCFKTTWPFLQCFITILKITIHFFQCFKTSGPFFSVLKRPGRFVVFHNDPHNYYFFSVFQNQWAILVVFQNNHHNVICYISKQMVRFCSVLKRSSKQLEISPPGAYRVDSQKKIFMK